MMTKMRDWLRALWLRVWGAFLALLVGVWKRMTPASLHDKIHVVRGWATVELFRAGPNGIVCLRRTVHPNLVVNVGKKRLLRLAIGSITAGRVFDHFRLGRNTVAAGSAQTNVITAITSTIHTCTAFTLSAGRTFRWMYSWISGGGTLSATGIGELAVLDMQTTPGGSMMARVVLSPVVNKTTADKLKVTYKCRVT